MLTNGPPPQSAALLERAGLAQVLGRTGAGEALPERLKVRERLVDV